MRFRISWVLRNAVNSDSGRKKVTSWEDVQTLLIRAEQAAGSLTLALVGGSTFDPQRIQLVADDHKYLIMLTVDEGEDCEVRSYLNPNHAEGQSIILGDYWDNRSVCTDFTVVIRLFKNFFDRGSFSGKNLT